MENLHSTKGQSLLSAPFNTDYVSGTEPENQPPIGHQRGDTRQLPESLPPAAMDVKYTPGPWIWYQFGKHWVLCTRHSGMLIVLDTERKGMNGSTFRVRDMERCLLVPFSPEHPDARLIAAAPELLEACQAALKVVSEIADITTENRAGWAHKALDEAIAKATK